MRLHSSLPVLLLLGFAPALHAQSALPSYRLQTARDSFEIRIQGKPMGFTVLGVTGTADGLRVTEHTSIGSAVNQQTEILLDAQQRLVAVSQSGRMRGQDARIAIRYANQRVRGDAVVPRRAGGTDTLRIDAAVPAGVIDDNLLQSLFAVLPWSDDAHWTLPVFSAGKNQLKDYHLAVAGTEVVPISSKQVDAYRVVVQGGESEVTFWVSREAPQRLLKLSTAGGAFELVRVD